MGLSMKELTKAEVQVMQILWELENAFVKNIVKEFPEPKPAYNTVSTIVRILEKKGFIGHKAFGKTHQYHPIIAKDSYKKEFFKGYLNRYFENSFKLMISFFAKEEKMSIEEMEELKQIIEDQIKTQKDNG